VAVARRGGRDEHACWDRGLLKNASTGEGLGAAFCKLFPPLPQVPLAKSLHGLHFAEVGGLVSTSYTYAVQ
jgi:hypothetical protein